MPCLPLPLLDPFHNPFFIQLPLCALLQAAILVETLCRHVVPAAQGQRLGAPQDSQAWGGRRAVLARGWAPLPWPTPLREFEQAQNLLQPLCAS